MASPKSQYWQWTRCRGRNGWDPPQDIPADMGEECLNVTFDDGGLGTKRAGCSATGDTSALSTSIEQLYSWVPGQDQAARELFVIDRSKPRVVARMAGGSTFTPLTVGDALSTASASRYVSFASLNGKLFIAYDSAVNRLHVFDPGFSTSALRRAGLGRPGAPSVTNTGTGTYPAMLRYYRVAFTEQRSGVTVRRSELGPAQSFTPSGNGTHARITRPTAINEGETHWEIYASVDDALYYGPIATVAVGTTTYDDNVVPSTYSTTYDLAPTEGTNTPFPSVKYLYSNGSRLFGLGVWETAAGDSHPPQPGTVYFTPALGSSSIHDEERCQLTTTAIGSLILSRNAGGVDRGLSALGNIILAFQDRGIWGLTPTENAEVPYRRVQYSDTLGAVSHWSIIQAEDEAGRPCVYFLDPLKGPYRYGHDGFRWVGKDVVDIWRTVNLHSVVAPHGLYFAAKNQIWWWVATGASTVPTMMIVLDVTEQRPDAEGNMRGGWAVWTGAIAEARTAAMMSNTLGASMSLDLVPYFGERTGVTLRKYDPTATDDDGTEFQAYVQSGGMTIDPMVMHASVMRSYLLATAGTGVDIQQTLIRNFGAESRTATVGLDAAGTETRVLRKFEEAALTDAVLVQVRLGDASANTSTWTLDRWYGEVQSQEPV